MKENAGSGTELYKARIRVCLDFDVRVNDGPIQHSGNTQEVCSFDLALLKEFLVADLGRLREMLTYQVAIKLGLHSPEDFEEQLLGAMMEPNSERRIFGPAIATLGGEAGDYWRETAALPPTKGLGDTLALCTENIFECFAAQHVKSSVVFVEEKKHDDEKRE